LSFTIVAAPRWWTTATSVSHAAEPAFCCAESFSRIFCEPASPGPVPTARTLTPGFWASNFGPRNWFT